MSLETDKKVNQRHHNRRVTQFTKLKINTQVTWRLEWTGFRGNLAIYTSSERY